MFNHKLDRKQNILKFVHENIDLLLSNKEIDKNTYKLLKSKFFLEKVGDRGVPRDNEIARFLMDYLISISYVSTSEQLEAILQRPYLKRNIYNRDAYLSLFKAKHEKIDIDISKLKEREYTTQVKEKLKEEVIRESTEQIDEATKNALEKYHSIPSILDEKDFEEPSLVEEEGIDDPYLPWYKKLNLKDDPFPSQQGLDGIPDDLFENIVLKTDIFNKYIYYIENQQRELFKDTLFLGIFGSGKSTLFDYLKKPLINKKIYPLHIQFLIETDFQSFMINFRKHFRDELRRLGDNLGMSRLPLDTRDLDESIVQYLQSIQRKYYAKGFVVFIDDLHKHKTKEEYDVVLHFLSHLQIFKSSLSKSGGDISISFYISGLPQWESDIDGDARYSGSYSRRENMPQIEERTAHEMLNRRLIAYSRNPESIPAGGGITLEFVRKIYRGLKNNKEDITFRSFISKVLQEFEKGNFDVLASNPIHIPEERIQEIRQILEDNKDDLKTRFNNLVFGGGIQKEETRTKCLSVLIETYLKNGVSDQDEFLKNNKYYFQRLARAKLIEKTIVADGFQWRVCKELYDKNRGILKEMNLSMEDYLLITFKATRIISKKAPVYHKELVELDELIKSASGQMQPFLLRIKKSHTELIDIIERYDKQASPSAISEQLIISLMDLTNLIAFDNSLNPNVKEIDGLSIFWNRFWYSSDAMTEFLKSRSVAPTSDNIWFLCQKYRDAFSELLQFLSRSVKKSKYIKIIIKGLNNEEISLYNDLRDLWLENNYFDVMSKSVFFIQEKLRKFLHNIYTLRYGDNLDDRLKYVDSASKRYILQNIDTDKNKNLNTMTNEFVYLNRGNYKNFLISLYDRNVGEYNWKWIFRFVFAPWTESDVRDYLSDFADFDIAVTHIKKGVLGEGEQSRILNFLLRSMDFTRAMNQSYIKLLKEKVSIKKDEIDTFPKFCIKFDKAEDESKLNLIEVEKDNLRIFEKELNDKKKVTVDLQDSDFIENYYKLPYSQFYGVVCYLLNLEPDTQIKLNKSFYIDQTRGSYITLHIREIGSESKTVE